MENENQRFPQGDIPTEVIIHYIVKDYRRMFLEYDDMKRRAEKAEAKLDELKEMHHSQILKKEKEIDELKNESVPMQKMKELQESLNASKQQNRLLAKAVISQNSNENSKLLFQGLTPKDATELEKKIGVQLREALIKLTSVEERLVNYQDALESIKDEQMSNSASMKSFLARIAKSFGKIDSAVKHIENFYKLASGIPVF